MTLPDSTPDPRDDERHGQRRALWHDVRSVLGAVLANVEYVTAQELPATSRTALREVEHEVRLVADIVEIVSARRDPDATLELDLRALLWIARRSGGSIVVDATVTPFLVRGPFRVIEGLVQALGAAATGGAGVGGAMGHGEPRFLSNGAECAVTGVDVARAEWIARGSGVSALGLSAAVEDGTLRLSLTHR